jgi:hypothetical protein
VLKSCWHVEGKVSKFVEYVWRNSKLVATIERVIGYKRGNKKTVRSRVED